MKPKITVKYVGSQYNPEDRETLLMGCAELGSVKRLFVIGIVTR